MLTSYIKNPSDLQTKREDITKGFSDQALTKTARAIPYVERAQAFFEAMQGVNTARDIVKLEDFKNEIAAACGFSDKARSKLSAPELEKAIEGVLLKIEEANGDKFREALRSRYLLTKGDSLGGSMRNVTGAAAGLKLIGAITQKLEEANLKPKTNTTQSDKVNRISWEGRILLFDITPRFIAKNIDVVLLKTDRTNTTDYDKSILENPSLYVACGELKGGIDPAGADEHWKTANSALGRIRDCFKMDAPHLFFIGAAIEAAMAVEIFSQLKDGRLSYAANLNHQEQFEDLVNWLINL